MTRYTFLSNTLRPHGQCKPTVLSRHEETTALRNYGDRFGLQPLRNQPEPSGELPQDTIRQEILRDFSTKTAKILEKSRAARAKMVTAPRSKSRIGLATGKLKTMPEPRTRYLTFWAATELRNRPRT